MLYLKNYELSNIGKIVFLVLIFLHNYCFDFCTLALITFSMVKNRNLEENNSQNFILKGFNSIQIGLYFMLGAYIVNALLLSFLSDTSPLGMMSIQIVESISFFVIIFITLLSMLAVFFSSRRLARKSSIKVWNKVSKQHFINFLLLVLPGVFFVTLIKNLGINYITPFFLIFLGFVLIILNSKKKTNYYLLATIPILLSVIVYIIPTYWFSSLLIVGGSFFVFGLINRN